MRVTALKTKIVELLEAILPVDTPIFESTRVDKDITTSAYPIVTYTLDTTREGTTDSKEGLLIPLSIEIQDYDTEKDPTVIDDLVEDIDDALNRLDVIEDDYYIEFIRTSIGVTLPVDDEYSFRRENNYLLKYNEK